MRVVMNLKHTKSSRRIMFELYDEYRTRRRGNANGFKFTDGNRSYYACEDLGDGWIRQSVLRLSGRLKGHYDVEYYSPDRIQLRSRKALIEYMNGKLDLTNFNFRQGVFLDDGGEPVKAIKTSDEEEGEKQVKNANTWEDKASNLKRTHTDDPDSPLPNNKKKKLEHVPAAECIIIGDDGNSKSQHDFEEEEALEVEEKSRESVSLSESEVTEDEDNERKSNDVSERKTSGDGNRRFSIVALCDVVDEKKKELNASYKPVDEINENFLQGHKRESDSEDGGEVDKKLNGDTPSPEDEEPGSSKRLDKIITKILYRIVEITNIFFGLVDEMPKSLNEIEAEILATSRLDIDRMLQNPCQRFLGKIFKLLAHLLNHHQFLPALGSTWEMFQIATYLKQNVDQWQCLTDGTGKTVVRKNLNKVIGLIMKLEN